jgi:hypothetical protein
MRSFYSLWCTEEWVIVLFCCAFVGSVQQLLSRFERLATELELKVNTEGARKGSVDNTLDKQQSPSMLDMCYISHTQTHYVTVVARELERARCVSLSHF